MSTDKSKKKETWQSERELRSESGRQKMTKQWKWVQQAGKKVKHITTAYIYVVESHHGDKSKSYSIV